MGLVLFGLCFLDFFWVCLESLGGLDNFAQMVWCFMMFLCDVWSFCSRSYYVV